MTPFLNKFLAALAGILGATATWKPATNVTNDLADLLTVASVVGSIDPNLLPKAELGQVEATAAGLANLSSGQAALLPSVAGSFPDDKNDRVLFIAVRQYAHGTPPPDSPAAIIRTMFFGADGGVITLSQPQTESALATAQAELARVEADPHATVAQLKAAQAAVADAQANPLDTSGGIAGAALDSDTKAAARAADPFA